MKGIKFNIIQVALIFYVAFSMTFIQFISANIYNFILKPLLLFLMALYLYFYTGNKHGRFLNLKENMKTMLIITLFYIIIYYISGLVFGFSYNPYNIKLFFNNFYQLIIPLMFIEYIRSALLNENKKSALMFILYAIIFVMVEINYVNFFASFDSREVFFKYVCGFIIPLIFSSFVYNYLAIKGSYKLILVFVLPVQTLSLIVPVVPSLDWFLLGIFNIIVPVIMFVVFRYDLNRRTERRFSKHKKFKNPIIYVPLLTILTVFVLFMVGVFKYEPIAIVSNSMSPIYNRGDIVIYSKPTIEELKNIEEDTIIIYSKEKQFISHRVIEKYEKNGQLFFITKGDANLAEDEDPVPANKVIGIYSCSVKYIGYPSVWLNQIFNKEKPTVETK